MCKAVFAPALLAPARNVESVEGAPSAQKAEEAFVELCSIGDVVPTEETEEINRGSVSPTAKLRAQLLHQMSVLGAEVERLQAAQVQLMAETEQLARTNARLEREVAALTDRRTAVERLYRHKDGRLMRRWLVLGVCLGAAGAYNWSRGGEPGARCYTWLQFQWTRAFSMTDDVLVMEPWLHFAAGCVRLATASAAVLHPF